MSGKTKNEFFRENEKLRERIARFEKRQVEFLDKERAQGDIIDEQADSIAGLEKDIAIKEQIIAEYRLTVLGQSRILSRSLWPKVKASMEPSE